MNKLELDGAMVAGNGDVGQRPTVATLMPPAATHVPVTSTMGTGGGLFTAAQWVELQRQSLIYNHMAASSPIPSYLLFSNINPAAAAAAAPTQAASSCYCCYNTPLLVHHYQAQQAARMSMLLQCMQQAVARRRCGRTDGKKWRCARDAEPDQKYCQRHLNRVGRTRPPPPARKQQNQHAAAAVDGHHRDRDKSAMTASAATHHTSHGNTSSGNTMREDDDDYTRGLLDFTGGVCLPEQRENRLSLNYDNIAELYCNRQVAATPTATASAASTATAMDDEAIDHGAAATWVGIGGPLGEALGLAVEIQWPAGSSSMHDALVQVEVYPYACTS